MAGSVNKGILYYMIVLILFYGDIIIASAIGECLELKCEVNLLIYLSLLNNIAWIVGLYETDACVGVLGYVYHFRSILQELLFQQVAFKCCVCVRKSFM